MRACVAARAHKHNTFIQLDFSCSQPAKQSRMPPNAFGCCLFQTLSLRSLPFSPALLLSVCGEKPQTCDREIPPNPVFAPSPASLLFLLNTCFCRGIPGRRIQSQLFLLLSFFSRRRDVVAVECGIACQWRHRGWTERGKPGDEERRRGRGKNGGTMCRDSFTVAHSTKQTFDNFEIFAEPL